MKDFAIWHKIKKQIDNIASRRFFFEREVWWCNLGLNVGFEEDGKGDNFERPILILKKFSREVFWGIPLTTQIKTGKFYYEVIVRNKPLFVTATSF